MRDSLRIRLTLWYVGALAAVLIAFSLVFYSLLETSLRQRLDGTLRSASQVASLTLNHETEEHKSKLDGEENFRLVFNTMHQTSFPRPGISVWENDRLVAEKPGTAGLQAHVVENLSKRGQPGGFYQIYESNGVCYRVLATTVWVPSSMAKYRVVANESLEPIEAEMRTVGELLLITLPLCFLLAAVGGYFLARKSLSPILGMARTAEQISSHNLEQRLTVRNPHDELGLLAETFNRVFERLQQSFRQQRQFMADASHELRTPVSVALTATQVSLAHRNHQPEELYDTLEVVQSQMLRLRRVVEDMFMLAQADTGVYQLTRTGFYLDEALLESIRAGRVLGTARGVEIRVGALEPEAACEGDEGLLRQLLLILIDNAVKYTPAGGHVHIAMERRGAAYRIEVADTGGGIAAADQPFIFDRFYRADKSRSRRQPGAGSGAGLGLAIAKWIAQLHQGKLWLEQTGPQGSLFCVEVPAPAEPPVASHPETPATNVLAS